MKFFRKYDTNNDGNIDRKELYQLLTEILEHAGIEITVERMDYYTSFFDLNGDMETSLDEFTMLLEKYDNPIRRG